MAHALKSGYICIIAVAICYDGPMDGSCPIIVRYFNPDFIPLARTSKYGKPTILSPKWVMRLEYGIANYHCKAILKQPHHSHEQPSADYLQCH